MEVENARTENFKLDLENTEAKLPDYLQKCIDNLIKNEGFSTFKVSSRQIPVDGGNYLSELYDINIKGKTKSGEKELNIFAKNVVPVSENMTSFMSLADVYRNECFFYKEVAKTIQRLEEDAGVPTEHRFRSVKGYNESTSEVILMENVAKKGFKIQDRMKMLPLKFFELSMQQLGRWHGASFVMRETAPEFFHTKVETQKYVVSFNEHWTKFMYDMTNLVCSNISDSTSDKAKKMLPELLDSFKSYIRNDDDLWVLCHGDYRASNILIREEGGEMKEILPVDYQGLYYGNPANDILYFMNGCNDLAFRRKHGDYLVDLYYKTMTEYLRYFDIDIEKIYPRKDLDKSLAKRSDYGPFLALCFYVFFYASDDTAPSVSEDFGTVTVRFDPEIVRRIEEIIEGRGKGVKDSIWG